MNWNPITDPNGVSFDVIFNNGGSLTLDSARTVGTYSQTGGTFTSVVSQSLILDSGGTLNGGGVMNLAHYIYQTGGNVLFTNTDGTIQGYGAIGYDGLSLLNQPAGIIQATVSGQSLSLNGSGTFTNNGLMRAQNGGTLVLDGSSAGTFTNAGTIRSENGSNVSILFSTLDGGTLDNTGSSGALTLNFGTLRDVTIAAGSTVTTGVNTDGRLENTLINHGTLFPSTGEVIFIASDTTLSGGGVDRTTRYKFQNL